MGQYYMVVNVDKKEYIDPSTFMEGMKLMEFACGQYGTLSGLAVLLASSNGEGGGDLAVDEPWDDIPGRWCGDRIVIAGDYDNVEGSPGNGVYQQCTQPTALEELLKAGGDIKTYTNISDRVIGALLCDDWFRDQFLALPEGDGMRSYVDDQQRQIWERARAGETFPRDINLNSHKSI
jgi:hypothetical protein